MTAGSSYYHSGVDKYRGNFYNKADGTYLGRTPTSWGMY